MKRHSVCQSVCASTGTHCMFATVGWQAGDTDQLLQQWGVVGECIAKFAGHLPHRYGNSRAI